MTRSHNSGNYHKLSETKSQTPLTCNEIRDAHHGPLSMRKQIQVHNYLQKCRGKSHQTKLCHESTKTSVGRCHVRNHIRGIAQQHGYKLDLY